MSFATDFWRLAVHLRFKATCTVPYNEAYISFNRFSFNINRSETDWLSSMRMQLCTVALIFVL